MTTGAGYLLVLGLVYVESGLLVGFFLPGDTVLFAAGVLTAERGGGGDLWWLCLGVFAAAVAGDATGYWTGRRFGRPWLLRRAGRAGRYVEAAERFYGRYGWWAVVISRFIPWVRTFTPVVAGVGRMAYGRFLTANAVGAATWGSGLVVLGFLGHGVAWVRWAAYGVAAAAVTGSVLAPPIGWWRRRPRSTRPARSRTPGRTRWRGTSRRDR